MLFFIILINYVRAIKESNLSHYELISTFQTSEPHQKPFYLLIDQPNSLNQNVYLFQIIFSERKDSKLPIGLMTYQRDLKLSDLVFGSNNSLLNSIKNQSETIYFDYQSLLSNSNVHFIQVNQSNDTKFYFIVGDLLYQKAQFRFTLNIYRKQQQKDNQICVNDCQSYQVNGNQYSSRSCEEGQCDCGQKLFGTYCQYHKQKLLIGDQIIIQLRSQQWFYISYNVKLNGSINYNDQVVIDNLLSEMVMSFGFSGIQGYDIPNLLTNTYNIQKTQYTSTSYPFFSQIKRYQDLAKNLNYQESHELYIGFYNPSTVSTIQFNFLLTVTQDNNILKFVLKNYVMLIILGTNFILALLFFCFSRNRDDGSVAQITQIEQQEIILAHVARRSRAHKGFRKEFIETCFPAYNYIDILNSYPLLGDHQECVICLDPMQSLITQRNNESMTQLESQCDQYMLCSVTPCFHIYHSKCLMSWFLVQKYCPICRETFSESKLRRQKKWINLDREFAQEDHSSRNNQSAYIQRITKSKFQIPITHDDESKLNEVQHSNMNFLNVSSFQAIEDSNSISIMMKKVNDTDQEEEKCQNILDGIDELKQI